MHASNGTTVDLRADRSFKQHFDRQARALGAEGWKLVSPVQTYDNIDRQLWRVILIFTRPVK